MIEPIIGEVHIFFGNPYGNRNAPEGWAFCEGQLLPLSGNMAPFTLLGDLYGGDGESNFALPDLRGRSPSGAAVGEKDLNSGDYVYKPGERVPPVKAEDVVSPEQWESEPSPPHFGVNFVVALEGIYPQRR